MFPTGAYLNLANPIGPANFIQLHPTTDVRFGDKVTLLADWAFVWRESVQDGIYGTVRRSANSDRTIEPESVCGQFAVGHG